MSNVLSSTPESTSFNQLRPHADIACAIHGTDTVLLDLRRGEYYTLNECGTRVWEMLCEGTSIPDIVSRLASHYDVSVTLVGADITVLGRQLIAAGLVTAE